MLLRFTRANLGVFKRSILQISGLLGYITFEFFCGFMFIKSFNVKYKTYKIVYFFDKFIMHMKHFVIYV